MYTHPHIYIHTHIHKHICAYNTQAGICSISEYNKHDPSAGTAATCSLGSCFCKSSCRSCACLCTSAVVGTGPAVPANNQRRFVRVLESCGPRSGCRVVRDAAEYVTALEPRPPTRQTPSSPVVRRRPQPCRYPLTIARP